MENVSSSNKNNKKPTPFTKLGKLYEDHTGYLQLFGGSVVSSVLIITAVFIIFSYLIVQLYMNDLRRDFENIKCHPGIIPFAGHIKKIKTMTPIEFTGQNFQYCLTQILTQVVNMFLTPIYKMQEAILGVFEIVYKAYTLVRKVFDRIRSVWADMFTFIMSKLTSIVVPFQHMLIIMKDLLEKTGAVMGTFMYIVMGLDWAFDAYMQTFIKQCVIALVAGAVAILAMWLVPFTWPAAAIALVLWIAVLAATIIVYNFLRQITKMTTQTFPSKPGKPEPPAIFKDIAAGAKKVGKAVVKGARKVGRAVSSFVKKIPNPFKRRSCFDGETLIKMKSGELKKIKDIKIGDVLWDGQEVISTMILKGDAQNPYYQIYDEYIDDYIYVTGTHKIYDSDIDEFINVEDYPKAKKTILWGKTLYCLITDNNRIDIGNHVFKDWED